MKKWLYLMLLATACASADELDDQRVLNHSLSGNNQDLLYQRAALGEGDEAAWAVNLKAGRNYGFYADCKDGQGCSNLDMYVTYNKDTVQSDEESDNFPLFNYVPEKSGRYEVVAKMVTCSSADGCDYHVQVIDETK